MSSTARETVGMAVDIALNPVRLAAPKKEANADVRICSRPSSQPSPRKNGEKEKQPPFESGYPQFEMLSEACPLDTLKATGLIDQIAITRIFGFRQLGARPEVCDDPQHQHLAR